MPPTPPRPRPAAALATVGAAAGLVVSGCGAPVPVSPAIDGDSSACAAVAAGWPEQVADADLVETEPASPATAAWSTGGDPAIIARCGVPVPGPTTTECIGVDDIDWLAEPLDDGMRFTSYGRDPAIEILIPDHYAPEPMLLPAFAQAARASADTGYHCT